MGELPYTDSAPKIKFKFNYDLCNNHYVPTWASQEPPGSALVSLCSTKNLINTPNGKSTSALNFIDDREIAPPDFQKLLSLGLYVIIPDLVLEVSEYLGCPASALTKATQIKRAARGVGGFAADVDLTGMCNTRTQNIFGHLCPTWNRSKQSVLMQILIKVAVDGKTVWANKFFISGLKGFLLLLPASKCGRFWDVVAFIYINSVGTVKCCMMNDDGHAGQSFFTENLN
jgi:hypothetical protein